MMSYDDTKLTSPVSARAQQTAAAPLTIRQAVDNAVKNYPSIMVSQEQINQAVEQRKAELHLLEFCVSGTRPFSPTRRVPAAAIRVETARYQQISTELTAQWNAALAQAQIGDALARLNIWRALLHVAATAGDIQPFLTGASQ